MGGAARGQVGRSWKGRRVSEFKPAAPREGEPMGSSRAATGLGVRFLLRGESGMELPQPCSLLTFANANTLIGN